MTNDTSDIYKALLTIGHTKTLNITLDTYNLNMDDKQNITIFTSDFSGNGKSTQIKLDIEKEKKTYLYFPLGGEFSKKDVIFRSKKLKLDKNTVIHLDLYDTNQTDLMMEFLFSILITRLYGHNEDIFYLPKNILIKIEIQNEFIDFFVKFPILTLFDRKDLKINNLNDLIFSNDLVSNIQIVANYLKAFHDKILGKNDIYFPGISDPLIKKSKFIEAKILPQKICQYLIFTGIKKQISFPTYYHRRENKYSIDYSYIRSFVIGSFIINTKYFINLSFTELLSNQKMSYSIMHKKYQEDIEIKDIINKLTRNKYNVISFDKIDPSLIFFLENSEQTFSIITNKHEGEKEYDDLYIYKNLSATNDIETQKLPNYKEFQQLDFLNELKEILNLKNHVKKEKNKKYGLNCIIKDGKLKEIQTEILSLEEIAGNYIFTVDNFIKIILIIIKIRANIPVIIMGETGCGKTFLVRKLSQMLNNGSIEQIKTLNIHIGISDQDIINFILNTVIPASDTLKKLEEEKKKQLGVENNDLSFYEKKLWVFLDGINCCKSMGLISELMCKHIYHGSPLPDNLFFIAACNPYKIIEIKKENRDSNECHYKEEINLNKRETKNIKKNANFNLVYEVHPLPCSLLNFIFDLGNLTKNDESRYIESIIREPIHRIFNENKGQLNNNYFQKINLI